MVPCPFGCSAAQKRQWVHRSPEQNFQTALEGTNADERRDAAVRIAESRYVAREDAFLVLDAVARTDPVAQVRCVAIRAFAGYFDVRPIRTLLTILQASGAPTTSPPDHAQALPPDDDVRWETVRTLTTLIRKGVPVGKENDLLRDVLIRMLETDPSRNVRIVAAEALAEFKDRPVLQPLVRSLRHRDFAIAERAERSLIALTGTTNYCDADAWEAWLADTQEPFANAGQTPAVTQPEGPSWWERSRRAWRRALRLQSE